MKDKITYMDCWSYISPLIPVVPEEEDGGISVKMYVMIYKALKDAEENSIAERQG